MSILASLVRAYERLHDQGLMPPFGYASQGIHACIVLDRTGQFVGMPAAFELDKRGQPVPRQLDVPYFGGRSGKNAPPYFLWDNSAYVLGLSNKQNFDARKRFEAFRALHLRELDGETDLGLVAVRKFLESWQPENAELGPELVDRNFVFRLIDRHDFVHDSEAAKVVWDRIYVPDTIGKKVCLISGEKEDIARIHPPIGSFENPARIVSFDKDSDAFASYGHLQAENAPTGIGSAFAYTAALNKFLKRDSGHRVQIGDASTVFWADAGDRVVAEEAESIFLQLLNPGDSEAAAVKDIADKLSRIRNGEPLRDIEPKLDDVRFYVLGLAPNAARISIRFYCEDNFGALTANYQRYLQDMAFHPWPERRQLSISSCVMRTAPARVEAKKLKFDRDHTSPLLGGELFRSIMTGSRFPGALLSLLLLRVRSDHVLDSIRIALIKGVIVRSMRLEERLPKRPDGSMMEEYLMRSDPDDPNPARRAGRLFAVIERAQLASLGEDVSSTVKDKFLGAAAATPQRIFPKLLENAERHHIKRLRNGHSDASWIKDAKHARSVGAALARDMGKLAASFASGWPHQHSSEEQGLFLIGYYQERYGGKADDTIPDDSPDRNEADSQGEE